MAKEKTDNNYMNLKELKQKKISELASFSKALNIEGAASMRKQDLIFAILQAQTEKNGLIYGSGVLECLSDGFGFLGFHRSRPGEFASSSGRESNRRAGFH